MPLIRRDIPQTQATSSSSSEHLALLKIGTQEQRWAAARALAQMPENAPLLGEALADEPDARIREALFTSLARIHTPDAVVAILPYLRSEEAGLRTGAIDALMMMTDMVESHIPSLLADSDPDIRLLTCDLVRKVPGARATAYLCNLLEHEIEPNVCAAAVEVLSEVGESEALPVLARCAERFSGEPFLVFSIKTASQRIGADRLTRGSRDT